MLRFKAHEGKITLQHTPDQEFTTNMIHDWLVSQGIVPYPRDAVTYSDFVLTDPKSGRTTQGFELYTDTGNEAHEEPLYTLYTQELEQKAFEAEDTPTKTSAVSITFLALFKAAMAQKGYTVKTAEDVENASELEGNRALIFYQDKKVGMVDEDSELLIESRYNAEVSKVFKDVDEALYHYNEGEEMDEPSGYRKLSAFNRIILACRVLRDETLEFVTWEKDLHSSGVSFGHYFDNYDEAKADFASRANFVEAKVQLTEMELLVIRAGLVKLEELDVVMPYEKEVTVNRLIEKIDAMIPVMEKEMKGEWEDVEEDQFELEYVPGRP